MKQTPLYARHQSLGARFVEFGGWQMPVQYSGVLEEHRAVREKVGLFDVSHMGELEVRGPNALAVVQELTVNNVGRLHDGQAQYSLLCLPTGGALDDILVFRLNEQRFLLCVNASNIDKDFDWVRRQGGRAEVVDASDEYGLLALQGPRATEIIAALSVAGLRELPAFSFVETEVAGVRTLASRTGYTGEDGWELYCGAADVVKLWDALLEEGAKYALAPAGLGARDTLRLERALPLYGHELDEQTSPLEAGLSWVVRFNKPSFVGREALLEQRAAGLRKRLVGLEVTDRGIARQGYAIVSEGEPIGAVTSGTMSPTLGKAIALGYVATRCAAPETKLGVEVRGRVLAAQVVPLPFYKR